MLTNQFYVRHDTKRFRFEFVFSLYVTGALHSTPLLEPILTTHIVRISMLPAFLLLVFHLLCSLHRFFVPFPPLLLSRIHARIWYSGFYFLPRVHFGITIRDLWRDFQFWIHWLQCESTQSSNWAKLQIFLEPINYTFFVVGEDLAQMAKPYSIRKALTPNQSTNFHSFLWSFFSYFHAIIWIQKNYTLLY